MGLTLVLLHGFRPELLVWPWNPFAPLVWQVVLVLLLWSVSCEDWACLPWLVGIGSLSVQMYVGYLPFFGCGLVLAGLVARMARWRSGGAPDRSWGPTGTTFGWALVVLTFVWLPVGIDLVAGDHNLVRVARYFVGGGSEPVAAPVGSMWGAGMLSRHLSPWGPWSGGAEEFVFGSVTPGWLGWLIAMLAGLAVLSVVAHRRRDLVVRALGVTALAQILVGVAAASRVEPPVFAYLVVWMLPLTMFSWIALLWSAWRLFVEPALVAATSRSRRSTAAIGVVLSVGLCTTVLVGHAWLAPRAPR